MFSIHHQGQKFEVVFVVVTETTHHSSWFSPSDARRCAAILTRRGQKAEVHTVTKVDPTAQPKRKAKAKIRVFN